MKSVILQPSTTSTTETDSRTSGIRPLTPGYHSVLSIVLCWSTSKRFVSLSSVFRPIKLQGCPVENRIWKIIRETSSTAPPDGQTDGRTDYGKTPAIIGLPKSSSSVQDRRRKILQRNFVIFNSSSLERTHRGGDMSWMFCCCLCFDLV